MGCLVRGARLSLVMRGIQHVFEDLVLETHAFLHLQEAFNGLLQTSRDLFVLRISVPDRDCIVVELQGEHEAENFALWGVELLANESEKQVFHELSRVGLWCPDGPPAAILASRVLPEWLDTIDELKCEKNMSK